jgi:murein DD-endopeptidase MepM/ murein hydrolase activator NlpD
MTRRRISAAVLCAASLLVPATAAASPLPTATSTAPPATATAAPKPSSSTTASPRPSATATAAPKPSATATASAKPSASATASPRPSATPRTPGPSKTARPRPPAVPSPPKSFTPADEEAARAELGETTPEMATAVSALRAAERQLPAAQASLVSVRARLTEARTAAAEAADAAQRAQSALIAAEQADAVARERVDEQRAQLGRVVRASYARGQWSDLAAVLEAENPSDLVRRYAVARTNLAVQRGRLEDLQDAAVARRREVDSLESRRADLSRASSEAEKLVDTVEGLEAAAVVSAAKVQVLVAQKSSALAAANAAVGEDDRRAAARQAVSSDLRAILGRRATELGSGPLSSAVPVLAGLLAKPVVAPVTSPYGMRVHPVTGVYKLHSGTDFGAPCGTPAGASLGGTVLQAGSNPAYGNRVVVEHGILGGALLTTTYNHLSRIDVTPGQALSTGDTVGLVGSTGYSTGCHLHLELLVDGEFVDPLPWLAP